MQNILFVCRTNGCLSLMAEAYMGTAGRGLWRAWSAGLAPQDDVDPILLEFLMRAGLGRRRLYSKSWRAFAVHGAPFIDTAILMDEGPEPVTPPDLPGLPRWTTWSFVGIADLGYPSPVERNGLLQVLAEVRRRVDSLLLARPGLQQRVA